MKTLKHLGIVLLMIGILSACNNDEDTFISPDPGEVTVSNNIAALSQRVTQRNEAIDLISNETQGQIGMSAAQETAFFVAPEFELVAEIASPTINGNILSATFVQIEGSQAFVSYHAQGAEYGGGFEVIDLSSPNNIQVTGQALYKNTDFNSLSVDALEDFEGNTQRIYLAGADRKGALVEKLDITNGLVTDSRETLSLEGPNANSVVRTKNMLYVTAGGRSTAGGLFAISLDNDENFFKVVENDAYSDAKFIAVDGYNNGNNMAIFRGGNNASIEAYKVANKGINKTHSFEVAGMNTEDGKNTITFHNGLVYVAMSDLGLKIFDWNQIHKGVQYEAKSDVFTGGLTNGVAVDNNHVYIANGAGGLYLADLPSERKGFQVRGVLSLEGSANYVTANDNYIIVANGIGGVKILKRKASKAELNIENLDLILQSFKRVFGGIRGNMIGGPPEFRGGSYSSKDANDLRDPENELKNQIQIPIDELEELNEIRFDARAEKVYKLMVYLASEEGEYTEKVGEFVVEKNSRSYKRSSISLNKKGFKYVIISAIPEESGKGSANVTNIVIKGLK